MPNEKLIVAPFNKKDIEELIQNKINALIPFIYQQLKEEEYKEELQGNTSFAETTDEEEIHELNLDVVFPNTNNSPIQIENYDGDFEKIYHHLLSCIKNQSISAINGDTLKLLYFFQDEDYLSAAFGMYGDVMGCQFEITLDVEYKQITSYKKDL